MKMKTVLLAAFIGVATLGAGPMSVSAAAVNYSEYCVSETPAGNLAVRSQPGITSKKLLVLEDGDCDVWVPTKKQLRSAGYVKVRVGSSEPVSGWLVEKYLSAAEWQDGGYTEIVDSYGVNPNDDFLNTQARNKAIGATPLGQQTAISAPVVVAQPPVTAPVVAIKRPIPVVTVQRRDAYSGSISYGYQSKDVKLVEIIATGLGGCCLLSPASLAANGPLTFRTRDAGPGPYRATIRVLYYDGTYGPLGTSNTCYIEPANGSNNGGVLTC
jgi:hypothetical protein